MTLQTEYVFVFLDDDFIQAPVDNNTFEKILDYMDNNKNVACFSMIVNNGRDCTKSEKYEGFNLEGKESFRFVFNATIWRRITLIRYLKKYPAESPWKLEGDGMRRSKKYNEEFYAYAQDSNRLIGNYAVYSYGYGIWGGSWLWNNKKLFDAHNLQIDMTRRPTLVEKIAHKNRARDIKEAERKPNAFMRIHTLLYHIKYLVLNVLVRIRVDIRRRMYEKQMHNCDK